MVNVGVFYPETTDERYPREIREVAELGSWLLFMPQRLGAAYAKFFKEYAKDHDEPTLDGLEAFQDYRYKLGQPELVSVNHFMIPHSRGYRRLGGPGWYNWNSFMELNMLIPYDSLFPAWQAGLEPGDTVPVQLRMLEPNYSRVLTADDERNGLPAGTRVIVERFAVPYLVNRMGVHGDQFAHVGEHARWYAEHRTPMTQSPDWVDTWIAYNEQFEDKFGKNPVPLL